MVLRVANGAGFWGDNLDAPRLLVDNAQIDFLTLEYLAELTMSILARQREKDPTAGYSTDFVTVLASLTGTLAAQQGLGIITNAGGVNPFGCARAAARVLAEAQLADVVLGIVSGDDLLGRLDELERGGCEFKNLETGQTLGELRQEFRRGVASSKVPANTAAFDPLVASASAYLGARPIADALSGDARIVITGRVADASLTLGAAVHRFGWRWDDWNRLAGATVAGHLIECGAQVTGGLDRAWQEIDLAAVGYPIAEIAADATCTITKPPGSGGRVSRETVAEQLVYEIGDPRHYLTPDVNVDFTSVDVRDFGGDRVGVSGASGQPAPEAYKVSLAFRDGYAASGQLLVYGRDCTAKARACGEMILKRVARAGYELERVAVECLGAGDGVPGLAGSSHDPPEVVLRIAVHDHRREAVERFTRELAPLITSGPPGLAGYTDARTAVRPVYAYWPTLIDKRLVEPVVEIRTARDWLKG